MIVSFKCKETEKIWNERASKKFPAEVQRRALSKLVLLEVSEEINDLMEPPGNRLESLKGDRKGRMSIRVNAKWRICFLWKNGCASEVEIVDYH